MTYCNLCYERLLVKEDLLDDFVAANVCKECGRWHLEDLGAFEEEEEGDSDVVEDVD